MSRAGAFGSLVCLPRFGSRLGSLKPVAETQNLHTDSADVDSDNDSDTSSQSYENVDLAEALKDGLDSIPDSVPSSVVSIPGMSVGRVSSRSHTPAAVLTLLYSMRESGRRGLQ